MPGRHSSPLNDSNCPEETAWQQLFSSKPRPGLRRQQLITAFREVEEANHAPTCSGLLDFLLHVPRQQLREGLCDASSGNAGLKSLDRWFAVFTEPPELARLLVALYFLDLSVEEVRQTSLRKHVKPLTLHQHSALSYAAKKVLAQWQDRGGQSR